MCFAGGLGPVRGRGGALSARHSVQLFRRYLGTRVSKAIAIEGNLERLIASMGENHKSPLINSYDGLRPPPDDVGRQKGSKVRIAGDSPATRKRGFLHPCQSMSA